jgi:hypothetical protein
MTERTFLPIFSQIISDECYVNLTMMAIRYGEWVRRAGKLR